MVRAVRRGFFPNKALIFVPLKDSSAIKNIAPFVGNFPGVENKATAYVCVNYNCKLPTRDTDTLLSLLKSRRR
jgi:uncharacterized protein YyaL (SSP411 family)